MNNLTKFNEIYERDIDMLIAEEAVSDDEFLNLFLNKISKRSDGIISVEISKVHRDHGETDITIIFEYDGIKNALLIEDKIDAIAMDNQYERYEKRGMVGIQNQEYSHYDIFIVAPREYLKNNSEAQKYPNHLSYEDILHYFETKKDNRSFFQAAKLRKAIEKKEAGFTAIADDDVTNFGDKYIDYCKCKYPEIMLTSKKGARPKRSTWIYFKTVMDELYICHKADRGYIDLTFTNAGGKLIELGNLLKEMNPDIELHKYNIVKASKAGALRIEVPTLDFASKFEEVKKEDLDNCFDTILHMTQLVKTFDDTKIRKILSKSIT